MFIARLFNGLRTQIALFKKQYYIVVGRFYSRLCGVNQLGNGVSFFGLPKIQKARYGYLSIGNQCTFRSKATSNLIGINRPCILSVQNEAKLNIGDNCGFSGTVIGCFAAITLENNVRCGANTLITDADWHLDDPRSSKPKPIYIEENVWLGVNVTVMKGVRIGKNSVIGAHSLVTKDIPANAIAAGNPCQVLKTIT